MDKRLEALIKSVFAIDDEGVVSIRVINHTPTGKLSNAAKNQSNLKVSSLLNLAIAKDVDGNPAIKLTAVEEKK